MANNQLNKEAELLNMTKDNSKNKLAEDLVLASGANMQLGPQMWLNSQSCVSHEHLAKHSVQKQVYVVVKNLMFMIEIGSNVDLSKSHLETKLLYDFDREDAPKLEVSYVKMEPLEATVNIADGGTKANVEVKIKVLTSQHEDMLFRVRISGIDPMNQIPFEVYSHPIKVISKLTQLKKKDDISASPATSSKKRGNSGGGSGVIGGGSTSSNDTIATALSRLEQQQQEQLRVMSQICQKIYGTTTNQWPGQQQLDIIAQQPPLPETYSVVSEVQNSFLSFITGFGNIPSPEERHNLIASLVHNLTDEQQERLFEFVNIIGADTEQVRKRLKSRHASSDAIMATSTNNNNMDNK